MQQFAKEEPIAAADSSQVANVTNAIFKQTGAADEAQQEPKEEQKVQELDMNKTQEMNEAIQASARKSARDVLQNIANFQGGPLLEPAKPEEPKPIEPPKNWIEDDQIKVEDTKPKEEPKP